MSLRSIIVMICLFAAALEGYGQVTPDKISVNFDKSDLNQVVRELGEKTKMQFYYIAAELSGKSVNLTQQNSDVLTVFNAIFKKVGLHFYIDGNRVFLSAVNNFEDLKELDSINVFNESVGKNGKDVSEQTASLVNKQYAIGIRSSADIGRKATVSGYVLDYYTKTPVANINITMQEVKYNVITDSKGYYSFTLPTGSYTLTIKGGKNVNTKRSIVLNADGNLNIEVKEQIVALKEVNVVSSKLSPVKNLEMGVNRLDIKTIRQVPAVFGEADVLRVVLTLPGVQTVGEASTGFNVRGGAADQNLIMLNDATVYNPGHFFGFFSAFNPDLVKDIELYKSTIPERFGGRLSSVLEVNNKEGDKNKLKGTAGIGLITSRLSLEGPIDSGRTSFIFGGRTTYSNWLLKFLPDQYKNSSAGFHDFNLGVSHSFNEKNDIHFSGYYSKDKFRLSSDTSYRYSNKNFGLKWRTKISDNVVGIFKLNSDFYHYDIESDNNPVNAYQLKFNINQNSLKADFTHKFSSKHEFNYGASSTFYRLKPGTYSPLSPNSAVKFDEVPQEQALENAIYFGDKYDLTSKLSLNLGLRYSIYSLIGPQTINFYKDNTPRTELNILRTEAYGSGKFIKTYHGPEFRFSSKYSFTDDLSVKAAFNTLRQYLHLLSNNTAVAPTDIWKLSDPNIKPQLGSQVSLGLYKNCDAKSIETVVEVYYKTIKDYLDYKSGATFVLNKHIETDVVSTRGKAYGVEFLIKKNTGKLNGWMSYTYSRTFLKMDDVNNGTLINGGNYYPANYDKPHAINFTGNYKLKQRYHFSLNVTYSTGRPITVPVARYNYAGSERVYYSDRNAFRIPDYFRTDISFNIEGNHKLKQLAHNSWTFGLYNVTGRKNAYSTYFVQENGAINGYKLSIFAAAIPFVNYNIRF